MDGSQDGELTVMEGLPGLFNSSDSPMRLVFISRIPEVMWSLKNRLLLALKSDVACASKQVQAVMADIPFVAIGVSENECCKEHRWLD